jgi:predicted RNA-binding Zn ribbon-like protein
MRANETTTQTFEFIGGQLCLDFVNTLGGLRGGVTREYLPGYNALVAWGQQAALISKDKAASLLLEAERHAHKAAAVLASALLLREAIYRLFAAVATGGQPAEADLTVLNAELGKAMAGARVVPVADGFGWEWSSDPSTLDQVSGAIVRSSAELLISSQRSLVRECTSPTCSWLFVDHTKNHRRRWCTMTGCGNVAKVRRYRQRQHGNEEERSF